VELFRPFGAEGRVVLGIEPGCSATCRWWRGRNWSGRCVLSG